MFAAKKIREHVGWSDATMWRALEELPVETTGKHRTPRMLTIHDTALILIVKGLIDRGFSRGAAIAIANALSPEFGRLVEDEEAGVWVLATPSKEDPERIDFATTDDSGQALAILNVVPGARLLSGRILLREALTTMASLNPTGAVQ